MRQPPRKRPPKPERLPPRLPQVVKDEEPQEQSKGSPKSYGAINYSSSGQPVHHALSFVPQSGLSPPEGLGADEVSGLEEPNAQVPTLQDASISTGDLLAAELATLSIDTFPSRRSTAFTSQPRAEPPAVLLPGQLFTEFPIKGVPSSLLPLISPLPPIGQHPWAPRSAAPPRRIQGRFFGVPEGAARPPNTTSPHPSDQFLEGFTRRAGATRPDGASAFSNSQNLSAASTAAHLTTTQHPQQTALSEALVSGAPLSPKHLFQSFLFTPPFSQLPPGPLSKEAAGQCSRRVKALCRNLQ
ncbi:hypothetical protein Efla_007360 [Eimeria flavescens]